MLQATDACSDFRLMAPKDQRLTQLSPGPSTENPVSLKTDCVLSRLLDDPAVGPSPH